MYRLRLIGKLTRLLLYLVWWEWLRGKRSTVHPLDVLVILGKVIAGADLSRVTP